MKYLKIFEKYGGEEVFDLNVGDYVIWKSDIEKRPLQILYIVDYSKIESRYTSKNLYTYDTNLHLSNDKKELWRYPSPAGNYIIYKSDNLQDCIDYAKHFKNFQKYNL